MSEPAKMTNLKNPPIDEELFFVASDTLGADEVDEIIISAAMIGYSRAIREGLDTRVSVAHAIGHAIPHLNSNFLRAQRAMDDAENMAQALRSLLENPESKEARDAARVALDAWEMPF